jgi:hypothetical protein
VVDAEGVGLAPEASEVAVGLVLGDDVPVVGPGVASGPVSIELAGVAGGSVPSAPDDGPQAERAMARLTMTRTGRGRFMSMAPMRRLV